MVAWGFAAGLDHLDVAASAEADSVPGKDRGADLGIVHHHHGRRGSLVVLRRAPCCRRPPEAASVLGLEDGGASWK